MNRQALELLGRTCINHRYKSVPLGTDVALGEISEQGWNVARGDLALPVTTLREDALQNNLEAMAEYCRRHDVLLAPHAKTTMAPQLIERQLRAGAWGLSAATPTQVAVLRDFGVSRILLANEIVEADALRWIAGELERDPSFEFMCLVDDPHVVETMDQVVREVLVHRKLPVLLELGLEGGRAGARSTQKALEVARAVAGSHVLTLAGVETYEGLAASGVSASELDKVDTLCAQIVTLVRLLADEHLFGTPVITVTAGGSAYFDRVVVQFTSLRESEPAVQLVLRSGCYLTHDLGTYQHVSPLDGRREPHEALRLENALEGWARVLSRPEAHLAILGTGKRDLPYDLELPTPLRAYRTGSSASTSLVGQAAITRMMDQHAFMFVPAHFELAPGDIVALGMSHPCTAFDKMRLVPIIDKDATVVDAVLTLF